MKKILSILKLLSFMLKGIELGGIKYNFSFSSNINRDKKNKSRVFLGNCVEMRRNVTISASNGGIIKIGNNVFFNENCMFFAHGAIEIGSQCMFGPNVCVYDHDHKFDANGIKEGYKVGTVKIARNVWIGANVVILKDTCIGDNCIIGAGCVVKGNVPDNSIITGNRDNIIDKLR